MLCTVLFYWCWLIKCNFECTVCRYSHEWFTSHVPLSNCLLSVRAFEFIIKVFVYARLARGNSAPSPCTDTVIVLSGHCNTAEVGGGFVVEQQEVECCAVLLPGMITNRFTSKSLIQLKGLLGHVCAVLWISVCGCGVKVLWVVRKTRRVYLPCAIVFTLQILSETPPTDTTTVSCLML